MPRAIISSGGGASNTAVLQLAAARTLGSGAGVFVHACIHTNSALQVLPGTTFVLREATPASFTVTLAAAGGNYTSASFAAMLQTALNAAGGLNTYAVAVDGDTGLLTVTRTVAAALFSFWLAGLPRIAAIMGFDAANPAPTFAALTGTYPVRTSPTFYYLVSPELATGPAAPSLNGGGRVGLLAAGARYTPLINDEPQDVPYRTENSLVTFSLEDEFGVVPVDLRGGLLVVDLVVTPPGA